MEIAAPSICVRDTGTAKGRGVFALRHFEAGEWVEQCPVVLLPMTFKALPEPLQTLVFNWGFLTGGPDTHALALGHGSLYNHDNPSNLRYEADGEARVLRFIAERRIEPGTELTINYNAHGGASTWHDNKWFELMKVQLIEGAPAPRKG